MQRHFQRVLGTLGAFLCLTAGSAALAQVQQVSAARLPRIHRPIDATQLTRLKGNTHPLAQPQFDQGVVSDTLPLKRMLLVMKPSEAQHAALRQLLDAQQTKGNGSFRKWLTPEDFGRQFGVADEDIAKVSNWLQVNGFSVDRVGRNKQVIEFSGTAGLVAHAFHTSMHTYMVNGERHYANAVDPQIPAALAPVVVGIASLNDFKRQPHYHIVAKGKVPYQKGMRPEFSIPTSNGVVRAIAPGDFYAIYNETPLLTGSSKVDGTGQSIAIVGRTDINPQDFASFRSLTLAPDGFTTNTLQTIVDGPDPGITDPNNQGEATLDTEWASATAPNATIKFVVSGSTNTTDGVTLSQFYIVDNLVAPVMTASFGACEAFLGNAGNAFNNALEEQAAAEGITSMLSSGDSGVAGCDPHNPSGDPNNPTVAKYGLAVSGDASPPFDVVVGGSQFNENGNDAAYWNDSSTNKDFSSALGYIPEVVWNESCSPATNPSCAPENANPSAGSGGVSNCAKRQEDANGNPILGPNGLPICVSGYAKPSWQMGVTGIPNDNARDLPDISLTAAGHDGYFICLQGSCTPDSQGQIGVVIVGGTSASSPSFAGIMALVNQATGSAQGQANYTLYQLAAAQQQSLGSKCDSSQQPAPTGTNTSQCIFYDVTAGDNSVPCAGGSPGCSATAAGTYGTLTGYKAAAGYDLATGLGTVNVANLVSNWNVIKFQGTSTTLTTVQPSTLTHGQAVNIGVQVKPLSGAGVPTGDVALVTNSSNVGSQGVTVGTLNAGALSVSVPFLPGGSYQLQARYAGDGKYGSSISMPVNVTVNPESSTTTLALTTINTQNNTILPITTPVPYGTPVFIDVSVAGQSQQGYASGNVSITIDGKAASQTPFPLNSAGYFELFTGNLSAGTHVLVANYAGDASFQASTSQSVSITITKVASAVTLAANATTVDTTGSIQFTASIPASGYGDAASGSVIFNAGSTALGSPVPLTASQNSQTGAISGVATATFTAAQLPGGPSIITAIYGGDTNYNGATSNPLTITNSGGTGTAGFTTTASAASVTVAAGQTAAATITVTPKGGFTGAINFTCSVANPTGVVPAAGDAPACSLNPATASITGTAAVSTALSVTTKAHPASATLRVSNHGQSGSFWWIASGGSSLACVFLLGIPVRRRKAVWGAFLSLAVLAVLSAGLGCGGNSTPKPPPDPGTPAGSYVVTVTATNGTTNQPVNVTVVVQ